MSDVRGDGPLPVELFEFDLPPERIAQEPARPRDSSRLMVLAGDAVEHRRFVELPELLQPGDLLVVNRTRVIPARLRVRKATGGKAELLLSRPVDGDIDAATEWWAVGRPGRALQPGRKLVAADGTEVEVVDRQRDAVRVRCEQPLLDLLEREGEVPLPPYIERPQGPVGDDREDYQTVFAAEAGAVAAPTASLHFTDRVLAALEARGVRRAELVLHVGLGTFLPIREEHFDDVREHEMHAEWYSVPGSTRAMVEETRAAGGRVVAVGTTSVRALESWAATGEPSGESRLFILPGFRFAIVDAMLTNFHLPGSTLLMLVSAFSGRERMLAAYAEAVRESYRFFSYGDAMLLLPMKEQGR